MQSEKVSVELQCVDTGQTREKKRTPPPQAFQVQCFTEGPEEGGWSHHQRVSFSHLPLSSHSFSSPGIYTYLL